MTKLVGILNITPDSFSDGNLFFDSKKALQRADQLFTQGASLVDVGAESTRPGAIPLTSTEEWQRLQLVLKPLLTKYPRQISVDTYHPQTAERTLNLGDVIINDVTGMNNPEMIKVIINHHARCIISQLPGTDIQEIHRGKLIDDVEQVKHDLLTKVELLKANGLQKEQIILDPGIGFGKTPELNHQLLKFAEQVPDYKVMIGYSRKRFLGEKRMELQANLVAGQIAIEAGAAYLRVHDVAGHQQLLY